MQQDKTSSLNCHLKNINKNKDIVNIHIKAGSADHDVLHAEDRKRITFQLAFK